MKNLILPYSVASIASEYYQRKGTPYPNAEAARKQFNQDKNTDLNVVLDIIEEHYKNQVGNIAAANEIRLIAEKMKRRIL
jgi:hypothetical protein